MKISIRINSEPLNANLSEFIKSIHYHLVEAGEDVNTTIFRVSKPITPMKHGILRQVMPFVKTNGTLVSYEVYFHAINDRGKKPFNYAYRQETHQYNNYTTPGTGSRYAQRGTERAKPEILRILERAVKKGMM